MSESNEGQNRVYRGFMVMAAVLLGAVVVIALTIGKGDSRWAQAALDGKTLTYLWRYKDDAGKEVKGEFIAQATGREREIAGRSFKEMGFDWRGVPLTSGVYYFRVGKDGIETVTLDENGAGTPQTILQFPVKEGATWTFAGATKAKVIRTGADFTDGSGKTWKDSVCVGLYNGAKPMGEMWFHPEIGSLASKVFFSNLGYNEQILKCAE